MGGGGSLLLLGECEMDSWVAFVVNPLILLVLLYLLLLLVVDCVLFAHHITVECVLLLVISPV